jgi:anti-sigma-K factor RskA
MTHDDAQELLAAYALDAVDGPERLDLERHVEGCVRCASELDAYRGVSSALGNVSEPAPSHVWRSISAHLYDDVDSDATPPFRALAPAQPPVTPIASRHRTLSQRAKVTVTICSVAAAALVTLLSVNLVRADHHVSQLTRALGVAARGAVVAAETTTGHVDVTLSNSRGAKIATFVLLDGHGYLVSSHMSTLPTTQTYQLWGLFNGTPISIGLMGANPSNVQFTVASSVLPRELAVTIEPASGASLPTSPIYASGVVTA